MEDLKALLDKYEKKFLLRKISDGKIKEEELPTFYKLFKYEDNEIKYKLFETLRKKGALLDIPLFSKITGLPEKIVFEIFHSDYKTAYFPVSTGELYFLKVIPLSKNDYSIVFSEKKEIKSAVKTISKITGQNFFVIFNKNFEHTSFMLALYSALKYPQHILDKYAFTGVIGADRDIYEVEAIKEKERATERNSKILISPLDVKDIDELDYWLEKPYVSVPFLQIAGKHDPLKSIEELAENIKKEEKYFSFKNLEKFYNIDKNTMLLYSEKLPFNEKVWTDYIKKDFTQKIQTILKNADDKNVVFHIGVGISALGFGLGVRFGSRLPANLYHYQKDKEQSYFKVFQLDSSEELRKLKEVDNNILEHLQYSEVEIDEACNDFSETAVAIYHASHTLFSDVKNYFKEKGLNIPLIGIKLKKNQGNLPVSEDWTKYVIEINSILNALKTKKNIRKYSLFLSSPAIFSFALGMAVGHVINIPVYAYDSKNQTYHKVFETVNIESKF